MKLGYSALLGGAMREGVQILWLVSVACTRDEPASDEPPEAASYTERGPWPVGTRQEAIAGTDGLSLPVQVWYPARTEGDSLVVYDGLLAGDAYVGVDADCDAPHPLVAFSHGNAGIRYQSPFFTEFLASHGYVVLAPDHVGNTFDDQSVDFDALVLRRPVDLRDAVDWWMAASGDSSSPYAGCLEPSAGYAVTGHSFGGWTALAEASALVNTPDGEVHAIGDDRVWAVIALAPWDAFGAITDGTADITVPTMILTGKLDLTTPISQVRDLWSPMTVEPRRLGVFPDAGHYSFSPVACLLQTGDGCGEDFIDEATFTALVNTSAAAFLGDILGLSGAIEQLPENSPDLDWTSVP